VFQLTTVAVRTQLFGAALRLTAELRPPNDFSMRSSSRPSERHALMKANITFSTSTAQTSPAHRDGEAICHGLGLPKPATSRKIPSEYASHPV
jgi:hypothetical protein